MSTAFRFEQQALALLREGSNDAAAEFRSGQLEAIQELVLGHGRLLVVQKTGWGKSLVYFIATRLLRDAGRGPALLVSPLLALMRNQVVAAQRMGLRAASIRSDNSAAWRAIEQALAEDRLDLLLVSPERLAHPRFRRRVLSGALSRMGLLVIDEAHCISDWGHDFRPRYRLLEHFVTELPQSVRLLATTATANDRVLADLEHVLGRDLIVQRGSLCRDNLALQAIRLDSRAERLAWLARHLPSLGAHGLIYTLTIRDAEQVSRWLQRCNLKVAAYTGQLGEGRDRLERDLLDNRLDALVATSALGMGFDKPDLDYVVHYQAPTSVVTYYQQVGRAGRGLPLAHGVLLWGPEDDAIHQHFLRGVFPEPGLVEALLETLALAPRGLTVDELTHVLQVPRGEVARALELLSLEQRAPVRRRQRVWCRTRARVPTRFWARAERQLAVRRAELEQMHVFTGLRSGHMQFLVRALDGDASQCCSPDVAPLSAAVDAVRVQQARAFLEPAPTRITPRDQWPPGGLEHYGLAGAIPPSRQPRHGRALFDLGERTGAGMLQRGRVLSGRFAPRLVRRARDLVLRWRPRPPPAWVTAIPSLQRPELVADLAWQLASALELPFWPVLQQTRPRPAQGTMADDAARARNLDGTLALDPALPLPQGPVLLVDDFTVSGWTLSVASWLLLEHGVAQVWPLVLGAGTAEVAGRLFYPPG